MDIPGASANVPGIALLPQAPPPAPAAKSQKQEVASPSYHAAPNSIPYSPTSSTATHNSQNAAAPFTPVAARSGADSTPVAGNGTGDASAPSSTSNPRQRSSIACLHCRRSKIRCVNTGIDTHCHACKNSGRECRYSVEIFKRSRVGEEEVERTPKRTKNRKNDPASAADGSTGRSVKAEANAGSAHQPSSLRRDEGAMPTEESALDPSVLTPQLWTEVYEIFEAHFGADLPFLHSPTFSKRLRESANQDSARNGAQRPQASHDASAHAKWEMLMLGILALTARLHGGLVDHICTRKGNSKRMDASRASEHYAAALRRVLASSEGKYMGSPSLATIQALLMLGLYEWGTCSGGRAWIHVGLAIRMAQAMGLQFEDDREYRPFALSSVARAESLHLDTGGEKAGPQLLNPASNDAFIEEEMRRRTFWSCFVMDRYLSSGKFRPSMLFLSDIRLQLPCSQNAFLFGDRVCTEFINGQCSNANVRSTQKLRDYRRWSGQDARKEDEIRSTRDREGSRDAEAVGNLPLACESGPTESSLSLYVRMVAIWGRIARWSCSGGIRSEDYRPWQAESKFQQLCEALGRFQNTLPRLYRLSKNNTEAHIAQRTSSAYILLQILYSLGLVALHRELLPFVPLNRSSPDSPLLKHSQFPNNDQPSPPRFYSDSAKQLFRATRDIADLLQTCHTRCALPETPLTGFGLYMVAFAEIYALHFPHMDPDSAVFNPKNEAHSTTRGVEATNHTLTLIAGMRPKFPMAENWFRTIHRVHQYYNRALNNHDAPSNIIPAVNGTSIPRHLELADAESRAESLGAVDKTFNDLGGLHDPQFEPGSLTTKTFGRLGASEADSADAQSPPLQEAQAHPIEGWAAVNAAAAGEPTQSLSAPGLRYQESAYANTQPPVLSRGSTPTPSSASMSPYPGPGSSGAGPGYGDEVERERDRERMYSYSHSNILQQQLGQSSRAASGIGSTISSSPHSLANITSTYSQPSHSHPLQQQSQQQQPPAHHSSYAQGLPSHTSPTASRYATTPPAKPLSPSTQQPNNPPVNRPLTQPLSYTRTADIHSTISGYDIAAFMDGISLRDLVGDTDGEEDIPDVLALANGAWSSVGAAEAREEGWLRAVWRA